PLTAARRRDVDRRSQRVRKALADMHNDGSDITIAATAARAGVHRSFIHRHSDLHAAVLTAAAEAIEKPSPASTTISHRSALAENANLAEANRRLAQRIRELEERLSELLGQQAFERSGLGAPTGTAALQADLEHHKQLVIDLRGRIDERDEELAAAREANRSLMAELNRS
ncbi:DUF6262 family protein, partial [Nocardia sp. NPDC004604]|uniref:DUF6262 family protein n=1 Tax=Nocardia sp. NPDC004604 TaxID=3157013 RepID=UPI0033B30B9A